MPTPPIVPADQMMRCFHAGHLAQIKASQKKPSRGAIRRRSGHPVPGLAGNGGSAPAQADAREHRRPTALGDEDQRFHCRP
jgi:hypothetical protein